MNASKKSPSPNSGIYATIFAFVLLVMGITFGFIIFLCLFAGASGAAIISIIIFVIIGGAGCYLLSYFLKRLWYLWSIFLAAPMIGQGLLFAMSMSGGPEVKDDIFIYASSGLFVLISSLIGGYIGIVKFRKRRNSENYMVVPVFYHFRYITGFQIITITTFPWRGIIKILVLTKCI